MLRTPVYNPVIVMQACHIGGWNLLSLSGRTSKPRTWHDLPADIIKLIDEYSYDKNSRETIAQIQRRHLQIKDINERRSVLQTCYLSVAVDYFVNRDYRYAMRAIKKAEADYRALLKADEGYRRQAESIHFYTCLLWGIILYIKGYDRRARARLKKCLEFDSEPAIENFIALLK